MDALEELKTRTGREFKAFAESLSCPPLICGHHDADGLTSAATLARAWERKFEVTPEVRVVGRGENVWDAEFAQSLEGVELNGLVFADLGLSSIRPRTDVPLLVLDHHVPTGAPNSATLITGYGTEPTPSTSLLAWWCAQGLLGEEAADDLMWLAAVGLVGDMADKGFPELMETAKKRYRIGKIREVATLVNAPRRSASGDATPALELLMQASDPADFLTSDLPQLEACREARETVKHATAEARRAPPKFGSVYGSDLAFVRLDTPCQVHPLIAQSWAGRLKPAMVFAANFGYQPGKVSFSGRSRGDKDLIDFLARHRPDGADPAHYGNGHRKAAGGALTFEVWNRYMKSLGFGEEMLAEV